jgi:IS30 family transposase
LRVLFAGQPSRWRWLRKQIIYQAIYDTPVSLTRPGRPRRLQGPKRREWVTAMRLIDERPAEVDDRVQADHWEADLIIGAGNPRRSARW